MVLYSWLADRAGDRVRPDRPARRHEHHFYTPYSADGSRDVRMDGRQSGGMMHSPIVHQPHRKPDHVCVRMQPVESPSIRRVGYNADTRQLVLHFYDSLPGLRTVYAPVPPEVYEQLLASDAMGRFVDEHIRYAYDFALVREENLADPDPAPGAAVG